MRSVARRTFAAASALLAALALTSCGGHPSRPSSSLDNNAGTTAGSAAVQPGDARVIQRMQTGGVIELRGDRPGAMKAANVEMQEHCGIDRYSITQDGEEVTDGEDGEPPQTAWRVHYACSQTPQ